MKHRLIRVDLATVGLHDFRPSLIPVLGADPATPSQPIPVPAAPGCSLAFALQAATLSGWATSPDGYHRTTVQFNVPDSDMPRVVGWFTGHYESVTQPPSDTLLRNVSDAVESRLKEYFADADSQNLFTSPFRIGWAFRYKDGTRRMTQAMTLMKPNTMSPLMAIDSYSFPSGAARSVTDIISHPCRLTYSPSAIPADPDISHIDIIAAPQPSLIPADLRCNGIHTMVRDGVRYRTYRYNMLDESTILGNASRQNDLRILASVPVAELIPGEYLQVPILDGALSNWKLLDRFTTSASGGGTGSEDPDEPASPDELEDQETPDTWEPFIDKITAPLDLGDPERRKWLWRVILRGRYDRRAMRIRVYASRHRQSWRLIADGTRGWATALAATGYRWYRVRLTASLRRSDYIDALTFHLTRTSR